jgi:tetratricopeptide (TPR) repeat protein
LKAGVALALAGVLFAGCATSARFLWEEYTGEAVASIGAARYARAEQYLNLALGKADLLGPQERGINLNALGELNRRRGRYEDAMTFFLLALEAKEAGLGFDHPDVAITMTNLALVYAAADGRDDAAQSLLERAHMIQEGHRVSPRARARTLAALADVYRKFGRVDDAQTLDARVRALREEAEK